MKKYLELTMYEQLLQLPLFQGLGRNDLTWIIEKIKFNFLKFEPGQYIVRQDTNCDSLVFILSGEVQVETWSNDHQFAFYEKTETPTVLQPEVLFGPQTRYTRSYLACTTVGAVSVSKASFWDKLIQYEVFRLNFLNILSAQAQYAHKQLWRNMGGSIEQRIIRFFLLHCLRPAGEKKLKIKMEDLATQLCETRMSVSKVLNDLKNEKLISLKRSVIEVPKMEALIERL